MVTDRTMTGEMTSGAVDERAPTLPEIARSLAFYALFYGYTVLLLLALAVVLLVAPRGVFAMVQAWTAVHRALVRHVLGIRVEVIGTPPQEGVFYALRHESFFEAIDLPQVLHRPCIFAKMELMRIPVWGRAGWAYGLIGVERDAGAKTLRTMLSHAARGWPKGARWRSFPKARGCRWGSVCRCNRALPGSTSCCRCRWCRWPCTAARSIIACGNGAARSAT
jgi:1-acyl-sn-glycerol-3-phosphate acyltransferase